MAVREASSLVEGRGAASGWRHPRPRGVFVPTRFDLLGTAVGAGIAMLLISWLLESPMRRSAVTTGIWFGILVVLSLSWSLVT